MLVACLGDVLLDVIVETRAALVTDDDTPAEITFSAGGQAANVATWVTGLGGRARMFGPRADTGPGHLVEMALSGHGVDVWGAAVNGRTGTVVSVVTGGTRSLASDPGDLRWLAEVRPGPWLEGADFLFVSGYALLRTPDPQGLVETAASARAHGSRVAVDLSSAAMISDFGADAFCELCLALRPSVVFATDAERATSRGRFADHDAVLVLKHGREGASFVVDGEADHRKPCVGPLVDVTGAGDALAAGYLVGGAELAMSAAARCVARRGAQPSVDDET